MSDKRVESMQIDLDELISLRQKVEELEANERAYHHILGPKSYQELAEEIAALKEAIKQQCEPVAYLETDAKYPMCCHTHELDDEVKDAWIPLYTSAPTKEQP